MGHLIRLQEITAHRRETTALLPRNPPSRPHRKSAQGVGNGLHGLFPERYLRDTRLKSSSTIFGPTEGFRKVPPRSGGPSRLIAPHTIHRAATAAANHGATGTRPRASRRHRAGLDRRNSCVQLVRNFVDAGAQDAERRTLPKAFRTRCRSFSCCHAQREKENERGRRGGSGLF